LLDALPADRPRTWQLPESAVPAPRGGVLPMGISMDVRDRFFAAKSAHSTRKTHGQFMWDLVSFSGGPKMLPARIDVDPDMEKEMDEEGMNAEEDKSEQEVFSDVYEETGPEKEQPEQEKPENEKPENEKPEKERKKVAMTEAERELAALQREIDEARLEIELREKREELAALKKRLAELRN
ncbi:hypothetical protein BDK51DRAFT_28353, partial [Blyttiomyces helicus]